VDCDGKKEAVIMTNLTYAKDFDAILEGSAPFSRLENGSAVPATIAKMGTYLHMLADRTSHYWCTDSQYSGVYLMDDKHNFTASLDKRKCNFVTHAMKHYWEQGVETPLAPQSWATLGLYYDEILALKKTHGAHHFFNYSFSPVSKQELIGDPNAPGKLPVEVVKRDAGERVGGLHRLIRDLRLAPIPGFETNCGKQW